MAARLFCVKFILAQVVQYGQIMRETWKKFRKMQVLFKVNEKNVVDSSSNYGNDSTAAAILFSLNWFELWRHYWSRDSLSIYKGCLWYE